MNMKKGRFIYWLISMTVAIFLIVMTFIDDTYYWIYTLLIVLLLIPNFILKKKEQKEIMDQAIIYSRDGDGKKYVVMLRQINRKMIKSKNSRIFDDILYTNVYMDIGDFDKAREVLDRLVEKEETFSDFMRFFYYKSWITYLLNYDDLDKCDVLLKQLSKLIDSAPKSLKSQYILNYQLLISKYNIRKGIYLEAAKKTLKQIMYNNPTPLMEMSCSYFIGVIEVKMGRYDEAKKLFMYVTEFNEQLNYVKKAKKYLQNLNTDN